MLISTGFRNSSLEELDFIRFQVEMGMEPILLNRPLEVYERYNRMLKKPCTFSISWKVK